MKLDELKSELRDLQSNHRMLGYSMQQHGERIAVLSDLIAKMKLVPEEAKEEVPVVVSAAPKIENPFESTHHPIKMAEVAESVVLTPVEKPVKKKRRDMRKVEMEFGKVWFVRMGIVSLLTGLVFLSNFAYQNYIASWGAGPRLAGLYVLAACLLGLGTYLEKAKKAVSNYGKVLGAGGIAILYYASYASHHIERLKVIDSALLGGVLLFLSAVVCLVYALWKKSNVTAVCSIALAFYSTSINPVGGFTLFSSLMLTATGLTLLYKLKSASIGFTTMLGAYLSFSYWQFFVNAGTGYAHANWFVLGYWILCTAAVILPRASVMLEKPLLTYLSLNNALFFLTFCIDFETMSWVSPLWPIAAVYGVVLLAISVYTHKASELPASVSLVYLGKGLAMITLALCLKLTGPSLALSLIVQGGLALAMGFKLRKELLIIAACLSMVLGFGVYLFNIDSATTAQHLVVAALFMVITCIVHFTSYVENDQKWQYRGLGAAATLIAVLTSVLQGDISAFSQVILLLSIMLVGTGLSLVSWRKFGKVGDTMLAFRELGLFSHSFTLASFVLFAAELVHVITSTQMLIITGFLAASVSIQVVRFLREREFAVPTPYLCLSAVAFLFSLILLRNYEVFMILGSLLPLALCLMNQTIKLRSVAPLTICLYLIVWVLGGASYLSLEYLSNNAGLVILTLMPMVHYGLIRSKVLKMSEAYGEAMILASGVLLLLWQTAFVDHWQGTVAMTALVYLYVEKRDRYTSVSIVAGALSLVSLLTLIDFQSERIYLNYFVALVPMAAYFVQRLQPRREHGETALRTIAIYASLSLFVITSIHVYEVLGGSALSICWALLGMLILSIGFLSKEIVFRTMAFAILGVCILRVYGADVWKLSALLRILSFITLGIVLLTTGYLYCRKVDDEEPQS